MGEVKTKLLRCPTDNPEAKKWCRMTKEELKRALKQAEEDRDFFDSERIKVALREEEILEERDDARKRLRALRTKMRGLADEWERGAHILPQGRETDRLLECAENLRKELRRDSRGKKATR